MGDKSIEDTKHMFLVLLQLKPMFFVSGEWEQL
jgi:hypothetical protein